MKKFTSLTLTALSCLVLAACSGGGKKDSITLPSVTVTKNKTETPTTTQTQTAPATNTQTNSGPTGGVFILSGSDANVILNKAQLNKSDLNSITVEGQTLTFGFADISVGTWTRINDNKTCCGAYNDVRFGILDGKDKDYFFYNGNPTTTMPTTGSAAYSGHFVVAADDDVYRKFDNKDELFGTVSLKADFASKTLTGTLSESSLAPININANINGNSFAGTAQSNEFRTSADVEGKFYGLNAGEIGGVFIDSQKTWGGAFGASQ